MHDHGRHLLDRGYRIPYRASVKWVVLVLVALFGCTTACDKQDTSAGQAAVTYVNAVIAGDRSAALASSCGPINTFITKMSDKEFSDFRKSVLAGGSDKPTVTVASERQEGESYLITLRQDGVDKTDDVLVVRRETDGKYRVCDTAADTPAKPEPFTPSP